MTHKNLLWTREELIALRERAQAVADDDALSRVWRRTYQALADMLDRVDAVTARCEVRGAPTVATSAAAMHSAHREVEEAIHAELARLGRSPCGVNVWLPGSSTVSTTLVNLSQECALRGWAEINEVGQYRITALGCEVLKGPTP